MGSACNRNTETRVRTKRHKSSKWWPPAWERQGEQKRYRLRVCTHTRVHACMKLCMFGSLWLLLNHKSLGALWLPQPCLCPTLIQFKINFGWDMDLQWGFRSHQISLSYTSTIYDMPIMTPDQACSSHSIEDVEGGSLYVRAVWFSKSAAFHSEKQTGDTGWHFYVSTMALVSNNPFLRDL